jgi:simple sugar transport system permease protein
VTTLAPADPGGADDAPAGPEPAPVPRWRTALAPLKVPVLAVFTALVVGGLLIIFTNPDCLYAWARFFNDPARALSRSWNAVADAYSALIQGALGSPRAISETLTLATPLILAGLAVAFAFKAGLFNIGANGQLIMGAAGAAFVALNVDAPFPLHLVLCLLAAMVAGGFWAGIAGVLRATTGAHEVITTIMLNFIALRLLEYFLTTRFFLPEGQFNPVSRPIPDSAKLPRFSDDLRVSAGILLALVAVAVIWWVLRRSTWGFEVQALGLNQSAARYAGMRTALLISLAMVTAGSLAGLGGATIILGVSPVLTGGVAGSIGFDAIAVALLGRSSPFGVLASALLFGGLQAGALRMQAQTETPIDIVTVIQALILVFVAAPELIRAIYRIKEARSDVPTFTTNWGR